MRRVGSLLVALALAGLLTTVASGDAPVQAVTPPSQTIEATGPQTSASFDVSDTDTDFTGPTVDCIDDAGHDTGALVLDNTGVATTVTASYALGTATGHCDFTDDGSASVPYTVTIQDTTPPSIAVQDITVTATGPNGAAVTYAPVATDLVDGTSDVVHCSPGTGSTFPVGVSTVHCSADDVAGNHGLAEFDVTVGAPGATLSNVPGDQTAEATGPGGAVVTFTAPTASDPVNGTRPATCAPASGATFPLGVTTVTCTAGGAAASFKVTVRDTTPPKFAAATTVTLNVNGVAQAPVKYTAPAATDLVSGKVAATCTPASGSVFPLGSSIVSCTAADGAGNTGHGTLKIRVRDRVKPPPVGKLKVAAHGTSATVTWRAPAGTDAVGAAIVRKPGRNGAASIVVYRGPATTFKDKGLKKGVAYRYTAYAYDRAGNRSAAVSAVLGVGPLISPPDGAKLGSPPLLEWKPVAGADYYNVQIWSATGVKLFSIWPTVTHLQLQSSWVFEGHRHTLTKGTYRWYVWPGFGPLVQPKYGTLIGSSTFTIT